MKADLKPCPFCGGEARSDHGVVYCDNLKCGAQIGDWVTNPVAAWNRRHGGEDDWRAACVEVDIGGIYDVFSGPGDAIRHLGYYIRDAEAALPPDDTGMSLADRIRTAREDSPPPQLGDAEVEALAEEVARTSHDIGWCNAISRERGGSVTVEALEESRAAAVVMANNEVRIAALRKGGA